MQRVQYLEIHVSHSCNLFCSSCSHYSQHHLSGGVSLEQLSTWSHFWNRRIFPRDLALLGGEPSLHPQLSEFIESAKEAWPRSRLILKTNGFFLHRHPRLREVLKATETVLELNCHSVNQEYLQKYHDILNHIQNWSDVLIVLKNSSGGTSHKPWTQRYVGIGAEMRPFRDGAPEKSWAGCPAKECLTLFEGRLWKCPPIAYLRLLPSHFSLHSDWNPYLSYQGISAECSEAELKDFLERKEEFICGMCPSKEIAHDKGNPLQNTPYLKG